MQRGGWEITVELVIGVKQDGFNLRLARFSDALPFEQAACCQFRMFADVLLFSGREFLDAFVISERTRNNASPFDFLSEFHYYPPSSTPLSSLLWKWQLFNRDGLGP